MKVRQWGMAWLAGVALWTGSALAQQSVLPAAPPHDLVFPLSLIHI
jgi:hypothetical protein